MLNKLSLGLKRCMFLGMVTHSWSNHFACLIASVVGDALELPSYSSVLNRLKGQEMFALKSELYWKNKLVPWADVESDHGLPGSTVLQYFWNDSL